MSLGYQYTFNTGAVAAAAVVSDPPTGTSVATLPNLTANASGETSPFGTSVATLPNLTASASGAVSIAGTSVATLPNLTAAGVGASEGAFGVITLPSLVSSSFGGTVIPPSGTAVSTLPNLTASASAYDLTLVSTTMEIPIELLGQVAHSSTMEVPIELLGHSAVNGTMEIPIELLSEGAAAGPEVVLTRSPVAHRLRAELYNWTVIRQPPFTLLGPVQDLGIPHNRFTSEFIGAKVGTGDLLILWDYQQHDNLDKVGEWSVNVPARDSNLAPIFTGEANVLKFFYEGVGHIYTGWISSYEVTADEVITLHGYGMAVFLERRSTLYGYNFPAVAYGHFQNVSVIVTPATYTLEFESFESNFLATKIFTRRYQDQSLAEIYNDLCQLYDMHWRMHPTQMLIQIGDMGTDSGLLASPVREGDHKAIEEGVLALTNLTCSLSDEEIINLVVGQGSNNSFGMAVELRHTTLQRKYGQISFFPFADVSFPYGGFTVTTETVASGMSLGYIGSWMDDDLFACLLASLSEDGYDINNSLVVPGGYEFSCTEKESDTQEIVAESLEDVEYFPFSLNVGWDNKAVAQRIHIENEMDIAFVAFFGGARGGNTPASAVIAQESIHVRMQLDICPDLAGAPDTTNAIHRVLMGNFYNMFQIPNITDGGMVVGANDHFKTFSEVMFFPNNIDAYWRLPAGTYWFVLSETKNESAISFNPAFYPSEDQSLGIFGPTWFQGMTHTSYIPYTVGNEPKMSVLTAADVWEEVSTVGDGNDYQLLIEVSGRHNTAADIAAYPHIVHGQFAGGVDDTIPTTGFRVFYIKHDASILEWGVRDAVVSFPYATDSREGIEDIAPASDALYAGSCVYLDRRANRFERLSFDVYGAMRVPYVGQKIRVVYRGVAENENGVHMWLDIDALYWVLGINMSMGEDGVVHNFTVASVPENLLDPERITAQVIRNQNRFNNYLGEIEYGLHVGIVEIEDD